MRLFIGVELDEVVRAAAADVGERLRQRLARAVPRLKARWIAPENLHITLRFIGEVPEPTAEAIREALMRRSFETPAFPLAIGQCGAFPPSGAPRVLWIGAGNGASDMRRLYDEIAARLQPLGYAPEGRPYTAHLTIARIREPVPGSSRPVRDILAALPAECGASRVGMVTLFRSHLSPRGAAYEPLLRVPLA